LHILIDGNHAVGHAVDEARQPFMFKVGPARQFVSAEHARKRHKHIIAQLAALGYVIRYADYPYLGRCVLRPPS
jgi:hypothetical protein